MTSSVLWLLVLSSTMTVIYSYAIYEIDLDETTRQCEDKGEILFCDFEDVVQDIKFTKSLSNSRIQKVFIYSATSLHLTDEVCVDLVLHNVRDVKVGWEDDSNCKRQMELYATESVFTLIHTGISKLYLKDCKVANLVAEAKLSQFSIVKSDIEVLNITGGTDSRTTAVLDGTKVTKFEKFVVDGQSKLIIKNSFINIIKSQALEIRNGTVMLEQSTIKQGIEGSFLYEDFVGTLTLKSISEGDAKSRNISKDVNHQGNVYATLFYICLMLLIISWIFFILYLNKDVLSEKIKCINIPQRKTNSDVQTRHTQSPKDKVQESTKEQETLLTHQEEHKAPDGNKLLPKNKKTQDNKTKKRLFDSNEVKCIQNNLCILRTLFNDILNFEVTQISISPKPEKHGDAEVNHAYKKFLEIVKGLKKQIKQDISGMQLISEKESQIKKIFSTYKDLKANEYYHIVSEFSKIVDIIFKETHISEFEMNMFGEEIQKTEEALNIMQNQIGEPVKKGKLEYYFIPAASYIRMKDRINDLEKKGLEQINILMKMNIDLAKKFLVLLLHIHIIYFDFVNKDIEANV